MPAFAKYILVIVFITLFGAKGWTATYYSKDTGNANVLTRWGLNTDGTGTAPSGFNTNGDIFILRSSSTLGLNNDWTIGAGVTLQVDGTLNVINNNDDITINGIIIFTNSTSTQISLTGGGNGNSFTLTSGATLKTSNSNGIQGSNCSLPATASGTISLNSAANFELNGATQNSVGLPSTISNLTISGSGTKTLSAPTTVTGNLTLTNGILATSATNLLIITNSANSAITGGSTTSFINGPVNWTLASGQSYTFPVGKSSSYLPFGLSGISGSSPQIRVEAFAANSGGTASAPLLLLSSTEYWQGSVVSGTYSGGSVSLTRSASLDGLDAIGRSATQNGSYATLNGTAAGTSVNNSDNTGNTLGFFAMALKNPLPCAYNSNTASMVTDFFPCINTSLTTWVNTVSNSISPKQYFVMNVIKGLTYLIYTCESGMSIPLQMAIYEEGQPSNPHLAFSYSNTGNPCNADNFNVYSSYTSTFTGKIRVLINRIGNCNATTPVNIDVRVRVAGGNNTQDLPTDAGTNTWIGHFYDGNVTTIVNTTYNQEFTTNYLGYYTESETFDQSFGGNSANNCFNFIYSNGTVKAGLNTDTYAIRYRMNSSKRGLYSVTLGSDDGGRLSIDGQLVYNNWSEHAYSSAIQALINLTGSSNLVYDFYENGADNRVNFSNLTLIFDNSLSVNTSQTLCPGTIGSQISGNQLGSLPGGITIVGTGYQWTYSTSPSGSRTAIAGATAATFTPSTQNAPFNLPGTYYLFRNAVLSSVNNLSPNPYTATNESNSAVIVVEVSAITSTTSGSRCGAGSVTLQATTSSGTTEWYTSPIGGSPVFTGNSFVTPSLSASTTYYAQGTTGNCLSVRISVDAYIQLSPAQPGAISGSGTVYQNTSLTYSVTNVPGTIYTWSFPAGWVQTGGSNTNSVTVTVGNNSGNITVTPSNSCGTGTAQTLAVNVLQLGISVSKNDLCISGANNTGTITVSGVGGQTPYQFKLNSGAYQSSGNFTGLTAATYITWVKDAGGVEVSTTVVVQVPVVSADDKSRQGTDSWIGHVYKRRDAGGVPDDTNAFSDYYGIFNQTETFNEAFGGDIVCFPITASESSRSITTTLFAVRFRMNSAKTGIYLADIGSDDGVRLTVNGTKVYDQWLNRGYADNTKILFQLSGTSNLLLEYFETTGQNRISFQNLLPVPNNLISGFNQSICQGGSLTAISSNNSFADAPISSTGGYAVTYQWQQASSIGGPYSDISGATAQNYTPIVSAPGTWYFRRSITVSKTNLGGISVIATHNSNPATILIGTVPAITTHPVSPSPTCLGASVPAISVTASNAGGYQWYSNAMNSNSGGTIIAGATSSSYTPPGTTTGTSYYYCIVSSVSLGCGTVTSNTATVTITPLIHTNTIQLEP